ncbi:MAG: hypothetical protein ABIJ14_03660 [Nanoarchaeota archaeon]
MSENKTPRWDEIRRKQIGYLLNTILILSLAFLGYLVSFLTNKNLEINNLCLFNVILGFLFSVIIINLICSFVRLIDFKITAKNTRTKDNKIDTSLLGSITWFLFTLQWLFFLVVIVLFLIFIFKLS